MGLLLGVCGKWDREVEGRLERKEKGFMMWNGGMVEGEESEAWVLVGREEGINIRV